MADKVEEDVLQVSGVSCCLKTSLGFLTRKLEKNWCLECARTENTEPVKRTRWLKKDAWRSKHCFVEEMKYWNETLENLG